MKLRTRPVLILPMVACAAIWLTSAAHAVQAGSSDAETAIVGATLIDGTGNPPLHNSVIVVQGNRIKSVGPSGKLSYSPDANIIDAKGKFVLPGLFDSHVHCRDWVGELFLAYGVTSVIDMGNPVEWVMAQKEAVEKKKISGPRIFASGEALALRFDSSRELTEKDLTQVRSAVQGNIAQGASHISVTVTQDPRTFGAIAEEAHKAGVPVSTYTMYPQEEIGLGVDALQHSYSLSAGSKQDPKLLQAIREETQARDTPRYLKHPLNYLVEADPDDFIRLLAQHGTYVIPSMIFEYKLFNDHRAEFEQQNLELLKNPNLRYVNFEDYFPQLMSYSHFGIPRLGGPGFFGTIDFTSSEFKQYQQSYRNLQHLLSKLLQQGGKVLAGTDAPNMLLPGISLHQELQLLVDAGLTPMQAIVAATSRPAAYVRKEADLGTVSPGKIADLLILDADPLEDIRNTRKIHSVIQGGKVLDTSFHPEFSNPIPRPNNFETQRNPVPQVGDASPKAGTEGDEQITLSVVGSNFIDESVVLFAGERVPTTFVKDTELKASVPGRLLKRVGTFPIAVWNPKPQGGISGDVKFIVKFRR